MFYSEAILSRRGPLAKVWLAAHMERKLSKTQTLQTDIEQSVGAIMGQEVELMALRLSGQLLLGVVRIYSRKAKYLLDDCNEALLKIKMAFRPGLVDMTEDQLAVNRNAITLQGGNLDLDVLLPDINWDLDFEDRPVQPQGQHVARVADITLATADDLEFDFNEPGFGFDLGPSDGIGSQDFDLDLGLDFGDGENVSAVEVGRDAGVAPRLSDILGRAADGDLDMLSQKSREMSEHPFGPDMDFGGDFDGMNIDLGLDFGDNREKTPGQTRSPSRASSPLTEPPMTPPPGVNITPRVSPKKAKRQPKPQKQIIDSVTELADGPGARLGRGRNAGLGAPVTKDVSDILSPPHYLPRSSVVMRLLEIREDPLAHFLPTTVTKSGTFFCAAPPGLPPQLAELFMRPVKGGLGGNKRRGGDMDRGGNKKQRLDGETDLDDVEQGMRAGSRPPSIGLGGDILGQGSFGPGLDFGDQTAGLDDFQMDLGGDFDMGRAKSAGATDKSRLSTPAGGLLDDGEETYADLTCPIAMFDDRPSQTQTQGAERTEDPGADTSGKGYSKNTVKALGIIRKELMPAVGSEEPEDKVLSFNRISQKASRRAASSFFFELLVLSTRDCIKVTQTAPFENIEIRAKDKLWERQRHGSVARSVASSAGL